MDSYHQRLMVAVQSCCLRASAPPTPSSYLQLYPAAAAAARPGGQGLKQLHLTCRPSQMPGTGEPPSRTITGRSTPMPPSRYICGWEGLGGFEGSICWFKVGEERAGGACRRQPATQPTQATAAADSRYVHLASDRLAARYRPGRASRQHRTAHLAAAGRVEQCAAAGHCAHIVH